MKKFILLTIVTITLIFTAGTGLLSQDYDIRKLRWGMSFEEVKKIEDLGEDFFKTEKLLGISVEVRFGFDHKGLYSVSYSCRKKSQEFASKAADVLYKKYGRPTSDWNYGFMVQSKVFLEYRPKIVIDTFEKADLSIIDKVKIKDIRIVLRNILAKQEKWEYKNTVALLLNSPEVGALNYWSKAYHYKNKKKFLKLLEDLKEKPKKKSKAADDTDKF